MKTERRAVARYKAKLAVQIDIDDYSFEAVSKEVSFQGLRVLCEGPTANKIFNRYIQVTPGEKITADIQIKSLKVSGLINVICCKTRVISVSRVSQAGYVVGFNIMEFDDNGLEVWQDYLSTNHS